MITEMNIKNSLQQNCRMLLCVKGQMQNKVFFGNFEVGAKVLSYNIKFGSELITKYYTVLELKWTNWLRQAIAEFIFPLHLPLAVLKQKPKANFLLKFFSDLLFLSFIHFEKKCILKFLIMNLSVYNFCHSQDILKCNIYHILFRAVEGDNQSFCLYMK